MSPSAEPGPLADEAARLVEAGLAWAQRFVAASEPAPDCTGCPVCRLVTTLRDPGPEAAERITAVVTDLATLVATGLRTVDTHLHATAPPRTAYGDTAYGDAERDDGPVRERRGGPRPRQRGSGIEHIDIA